MIFSLFFKLVGLGSFLKMLLLRLCFILAKLGVQQMLTVKCVTDLL